MGNHSTFPSFKYQRTPECSPQLKSRRETNRSYRFSTLISYSKAENNCFLIFHVPEMFTVANSNLAQSYAIRTRTNFLFWLFHALSFAFPSSPFFHQQTPQTQGFRIFCRQQSCIFSNFSKTTGWKVKEMLVLVKDFITTYYGILKFTEQCQSYRQYIQIASLKAEETLSVIQQLSFEMLFSCSHTQQEIKKEKYAFKNKY